MKSVMVVHDIAPTVLPTGNDEDGTRKLQILAPCLKCFSSETIFIFSLERSENSLLQIPNQQRTVQHLTQSERTAERDTNLTPEKRRDKPKQKKIINNNSSDHL